jgi:hypothetical protein
VLQIAQGRYAPHQYRGFIGFKVAKPVFERAVLDTYGLEMKDLFKNLNLSLGTYRYTVRSILPGMTRVAWQLKKTDIIKEIPGITRKKFLYNLSRASYEKEWGSEYQKLGIRARIVTSLFRIIPKSGPFKSLPFRMPTPEVERIFMASFNATVDRYRVLLAEVGAGPLILPNENIDTGELTHAGKYKGADEAYAKLVGKLAHRQFVGMSPELRSNILAFYKDVHAPTATEKQSAEWANLGDELGRLQAVPVKQP